MCKILLCGIIKPAAISHAEEILDTLRSSSIIIHKTKLILYTHDLIEILYDHMSPSARHGIAQKLAGHTGIAILLSAPSIQEFLEIIGTESDPHACAPGTIRARFGVHDVPARVGDGVWFENAFHRPINSREAKRDLWHIFNIRTDE